MAADSKVASYGSADSTSSSSGPSRRRSSLIEVVQEKLHSHMASTMALCVGMFSMFYLLFSVFPYSGFMVMHLVPGVDSENAGVWAGFLSSSFMVGRAFSAYLWGKIADIYGRKFVLIVSCVVSAVGSIAFGCSSSFAMAVTVRFLMGLGNGMNIVCRTAISELAKGDKELESRGVGILMSMVGYSMLLSPSLGGLLSEPMRQYPDANILNGRFDDLLTKYPFLPPNIIAFFLSIWAIFAISASVEETLPAEKRRPLTHVGGDLLKYFVNLGMRILGLCGLKWGIDFSEVQSATFSTTDTSTIASTSSDDEWEEDMKILDDNEEFAAAALVATGESRASFSSALHRPSAASRRRSSILQIHHDIERAAKEVEKMETILSERTPLNPQSPSSDETSGTEKSTPVPANAENSMAAIFGNPDTRVYLLSYWITAFASVCQTEALPLFAMSHSGGLGLEEKTIGLVGTLSGLMFCIGQYFIFTQAMRIFGLVHALRFGAFGGTVPAVLMPFGLFLKGWAQVLYLAFISGGLMICNSVYLGASVIGANRTVDSSQRAAMNGLSSLGTSIGRGLGPIVAGLLVAFSMTSGVIPAELGGWVIYVVLGLIGLISYWSTLKIDPDEEPEK